MNMSLCSPRPVLTISVHHTSVCTRATTSRIRDTSLIPVARLDSIDGVCPTLVQVDVITLLSETIEAQMMSLPY